MNDKKKNNVTLNDLANMVARGFENTVTKDEFNAEMGEVKSRLNNVEQRLGKLDYRVDEIYEILARFEEGDILDLQKRIKILERTVKAMAASMK